MKINLTPEEQLYQYDNLPDKMVIYRGMSIIEYRSKNFGFSWTLSKEKAEFFAIKFGRNFDTAHDEKLVCSISISKSDVIGYDNGRKEREVYFIPDKEQIKLIKIEQHWDLKTLQKISPWLMKLKKAV